MRESVELGTQIRKEIRNFVSQPFYPCVAAVQAAHSDELDVHLYRGFGEGQESTNLYRDLMTFLCRQMRTRSTLLSFFAVFPDCQTQDESDFESRLWRELSMLAATDTSGAGWDPRFSSDPSDQNFCFSLAGHAFFVVGLHAHSSRTSRQFPYPTLVFNVYEQFLQLARAGQYVPMIEKNRRRALKFEGSVNPMVENYGDTWEAIQFSGRKNDASWKCPFVKTLHPRSK